MEEVEREIASIREARLGIPMPKLDTDKVRERHVELDADAASRVEDLHDQLDQREDLAFYEAFANRGLHRQGLQLAHQLFLYGLPQGRRKNVPIRRAARLARLSGVPRARIEPFMESWSREAMRIAREATPMFAFACSEEAREVHKEDLEKVRGEIEELEDAAKLMEKGSKQHLATLSMLDRLRKSWLDSSGVGSGIKISEAAAKLHATEMVKSLLSEDKDGQHPENNDGSKAKSVAGTVFDME